MARQGDEVEDSSTEQKSPGWRKPQKHRRYNQPPCMFCRTFQDAPEKAKAKGVKLCPKMDRFVFPMDFCSNFEPAVHFTCETYGYKLNAAVCLHRRTPQCDYGGYYDTCKDCQFGRSLFYYESGTELEYIIQGE